MSTEVQELTAGEHSLRTIYEGIVSKGVNAFIEVGTALMQLRDKRLYRDTHATFESYCLDKWELSKTHINRLINASAVVETLSEMTPNGVKPKTESQVRPLTELPAEEQAEVWQEVVEAAPKDEDGEPVITQRQVRNAVNARQGKQIATIWTDLGGKLDSFNKLFVKHAQECDEAAEVCDALDALRKKFDYYVRQVEGN